MDSASSENDWVIVIMLRKHVSYSLQSPTIINLKE